MDKANVRWESQLKKLRTIRDAEQAKANRATTVKNSLERAFQTAQPLSDITMAASSALPSGAWLIGVNTERGKPLQLRGTATNGQQVATLVEALSASPRFRDVRLVFANAAKIAETPVVQFNVAATAVGNLPLPAPEKGNKRGARSSSPVKTASTMGAAGGTP